MHFIGELFKKSMLGERIMHCCLEQMLGMLPNGAKPAEVKAEPEQTDTRRVDVGWTEGAISPRLMMGWKIPGFDPSEKDSAAIVSEAEESCAAHRKQNDRCKGRREVAFKMHPLIC